MTTKTLSIRLALENAGAVERDLKDIGRTGEQSLHKIERAADPASRELLTLSNVTGKLKGALALLGTAAVGNELIRGIGTTVRSVNELGDAADRIGISAERLQELRFAADQNAASAEAMDTALSQLSRRLGQFAQDGTGPAAKAFEQLGIDARDSQGAVRDVGAVFDEITKKLPTVGSQAERAALAVQFMGKQAGELVPLLAAGSGELQKTAEDLRHYGGVLDDELVSRTQALNDEWDRFATLLSGNVKRAILGVVDAFGLLPDTPQSKIADLKEEIAERREKLAKGGLGRDADSDGLFGVIGNMIKGGTVEGVQRDIDRLTRNLEEQEALLAKAEAVKKSALAAAAANDNEETTTGKGAKVASSTTPVSARAAAPSRNPALETLEALRFEEEQLRRTSDQQRLYNELKRADVGLDSDQGKQIQAIVSRLETQERLNETLEEGQRVTADLRTDEEKLRDEFQRLGDLFQSGAITWETYGRGIGAVNEKLWALNDTTKEISRFAQDLGFSFSSAFEDAVVGGKKFGDVLQGLAEDLIRLTVRQAITAPLAEAFSAGIGSFLPSFGGARASGGPVSPGKAYLVGEDGPELLIPQSASTIVPNGAARPVSAVSGGNGGGTIVQIIDQRRSDSPAIEVSQQQGPDGQLLIQTIVREVATDIAQRGVVGQTLERAYNLNRAVARR